MMPPERQRGLRIVAAGWAIFGIAALALDAGVVLLGVWGWFSMADALATDRARTLAELGATFVVLLVLAGLAFLTAAGLWRLRRWAWWSAMGLQLCLGAFLLVRLVATGALGFALLIALPTVASWALIRPESRRSLR